MERLLDPKSVQRRELLIEQARAVYRDPAFDPSTAAAALLQNARDRSAEARDLEEARIAGIEMTARDADQQVKRAARGAEREELLAQIEELGAWYRDLVAVAVGADAAAIHLDLLPLLREDATRERLVGAERAAEHVRDTGACWRSSTWRRRSRSRRSSSRSRTSSPSEGARAAAAKLAPQYADVAQLVEHFTRNEGVPVRIRASA